MAEHRSPKPGVAGSIPVSPAIRPKLFLTGDPSCGKSTAIGRVVQRLSVSVPMTGFVTEEILRDGSRVGFQGRTLDGRTFGLAHVDVGGPYRLGPYGVDVAALEEIGLAALKPDDDSTLVILDEVGKMESFSPRFRTAVEGLLAGPNPLLGTVAAHGVGFVKRVRHDPRIELLHMSRVSRAAIVGDILRALARHGIGSDIIGRRRNAADPSRSEGRR